MENEKSEEKKKLSGFKAFADAVGKNTQEAASKAAVKVKEGGEKMGVAFDKFITEQDKKRLCPVFQSDFESVSFCLPSIIQIVDYDKRLNNKVCEGSVGYETHANKTRILTVYTQFVHLLNVRFYPQQTTGVYYVNPCYPDLYINISEYFPFMKQVRVDELENVAHALGAVHFKVTLNIHDTSTSRIDGKASAGARAGKRQASSDSTYSQSNNSQTSVSVAADIAFTGSDEPMSPQLVYFKDDTDINSLIQMRMNAVSANRIKSKTYSIQYGKSSGIKVEETTDIEVALKRIGCDMAESFTQSIVNENNTILEYTIDF